MAHGIWRVIDLVLVGVLFFAPLIFLVWIYNDADERYNSGCFWVIIILIFNWFGIIYYFVMRYFFERKYSVPTLDEKFPLHTSHLGKFGRGIIGKSDRGSEDKKTMHGGPDWPDAPEFRDSHAEDLIEQRKFDEAEAYLRDMAKIARADDDEKRITTYRYYYKKMTDSREAVPPREDEDDGSKFDPRKPRGMK